MKYRYSKNKKGLSAVVAVLLLVLLAVVLVGIIWTVVSNLVNKSLDDTQSCLNIQQKVKIRDANTCYNATSKEFYFFIEIKDIDLDKILVSISSEGASNSIEIEKEDSTSAVLRPYTGAYGDYFKLPDKNAGLTYIYNMSTKVPTAIEVIPVVGGTQCDKSDDLFEIYGC